MSYPTPAQPAQPSPAPRKSNRRLLGLIAGLIGLLTLGICVGGVLVGDGQGDNATRAATGATRAALPKDKCGGGLCDAGRATEESGESDPIAALNEAGVFTAGTYEVGKKSDPAAGVIAPGTYTVGTLDHCYWVRLSGFSGEFDDIIANGNVDTGEIVKVQVKRTDKGLQLKGETCLVGTAAQIRAATR